MAVKYPKTYDGMYIGDMSVEQANYILATRNSKCIPNLTASIYDFPIELVRDSLETDKSIRSILKSRNEDIDKYESKLRDYQTVGTAFMYLSPRSILGDYVGLGKTVEIAALLNFLKKRGQMKRFLIAVENSALGQVQCELMRFTGLKIVALPSLTTKMTKAIHSIDWRDVDGIIIKHSSLRNDYLSKWIAVNLKDDGSNKIYDTFILDESLVIKNEKTKVFEYTHNICRSAKRVHFLNATTFETNILDIYYQIDMMDENLLPKKWRIESNYCTFRNGTYWIKSNGKAQMRYKRELSGYKNQADFKKSLALVYFGRCKADVGLDLPSVYRVYTVEPTVKQSVAIQKGYRYMEVLNCPSLIPELGINMDKKDVPKLDRLLSVMENEFSQSSVMIYCFHIEAQHAICDALKAAGRNPAILNGNSTDEEKADIQDKFNHGGYDVLITNIKKSLNLSGGDACIFYSVITVPAEMLQVAGRIDRHVDNKSKTFVLLLYEHTAEYTFFKDVVKNRSKDSRELTIDAKTTVDYFIEAMQDK